MRKQVFILLLIGALSACGGGKIVLGGPKNAVNVVEGDSLPAPMRGDLTSFDRPYLIGPFDKISIEVFNVPDLTRQEVQIDASGQLSFPLVGEIAASGKTPAELARLIEARLRGNYVRNPQVTVNLRQTVSQVVTVDGQVKSPGLYPVIGKLTLMRAIATAKGLDEFARQEDIVVFRTVNGQKMAALFNLKAIRRGYYDDPELYANDVVVVGDSQARRIFRDFLTVAPVLTYPLVTLLQN
jgi:polysaccharide export outer membrane protein